jgi:hypothetical protein
MARGIRTLARAGLTVVAVAAAASAIPITFTGNVVNDFDHTEPSVFVATDLSIPVRYEARNTDSGWNIVDIRFSYDAATDTAYFGAWAVRVRARALCVRAQG